MAKKSNKEKNPFSPAVAKKIFLAAGYCCSFPECHIHVKESNDSNSGCGEAAHIYDSSSKFRIRPIPKNVKSTFVSSEDNGILLCRNHHRMIDSRENKSIYTPDLLFKYKETMEDVVSNFFLSLNKGEDYNYEKSTLAEKEKLHSHLKSRVIPKINTQYLDNNHANLLRNFQMLNIFKVKFDSNQMRALNKCYPFYVPVSNFDFLNLNADIQSSAISMGIERILITPVMFRTVVLNKLNDNFKKLRFDNLKLHYNINNSMFVSNNNLLKNPVLCSFFKITFFIDVNNFSAGFNIENIRPLSEFNIHSSNLGSFENDILLFEILSGCYDLKILEDNSLSEILCVNTGNEHLDPELFYHTKNFIYSFCLFNYIHVEFGPFVVDFEYINNNYEFFNNSISLYYMLRKDYEKFHISFSHDLSKNFNYDSNKFGFIVKYETYYITLKKFEIEFEPNNQRIIYLTKNDKSTIDIKKICYNNDVF